MLTATVLIMASCGSYTSMKDSLKNVELGMTKQQVISIMGNNYTPIAAIDSPDGKLERISYSNSVYEVDYIFVFRNGKLFEWHKEDWADRKQKQTQNQNQRPSRPSSSANQTQARPR